MEGRQWADTPFTPIPTPRITHNDPKNLNPTIRIATEMALAHNAFFRALNAIYLQCLFVKEPVDISDFLVYCQCLFEMVAHHHDNEEAIFFPEIAKYTGEESIMESNIEGHKAFHDGLERFGKWAYETKPETYDGQALKSIIDSFAAPFSAHMRDEIDSLLSLEKYGSENLVKAYDLMEKNIIATSDNFRLTPLVLGASDLTYEGGIHHWPPVPFFVPHLVHYYYERKFKGAWRFSPCDTYGKPRRLLFLPEQ